MFRKTLQFKLLIFLGLIVVISLAINTTAYYATLRLENFGALINEVGALRKNTYAMAFVLINDFDQKEYQSKKNYQSEFITKLVTYEKPFIGDDKEIIVKTKTVIDMWFNDVVVLLDQKSLSKQSFNAAESKLIYNFTLAVDDLVLSFEKKNGANIETIRSFNLLIVVISILVAVILIIYTYRTVLIPITKLKNGIKHITLGNFNYKIQLNSKDEFEQLANAFNDMSDNLYIFHNKLDRKVKEKTLSLIKSKHKLKFLYKTTALIHKTTSISDKMNKFLRLSKYFTNADALCIRLSDKDGNCKQIEAQIGLDEKFLNDSICILHKDCLDNFTQSVKCESRKDYCIFCNFTTIKTFELKTSNSKLGILTLFFKEKKELSSDNSELIKLLCTHISIALENNKLLLENQVIEVYKERNRISQVLHDDIAQTLSYMSIELQRLNKACVNKDYKKQEHILTQIDSALKEAYDGVRELLNSYRLNFTLKAFDDVLFEVCNSFTKRCGIGVKIKHTSLLCKFLTQLQISQIYFILQESLTNIRKHAKSTLVELVIFDKENFIIQFDIIDYGVGFDINKVDINNHVGLSIMQERALSIGATFNVSSNLNEGTKISLQVKVKN